MTAEAWVVVDGEDGWAVADAAPEAVTDLVEVVHGVGRPGQRYHEFANGCLYEIVLEEEGRVPRLSVVAQLDHEDLPSLARSLRKAACVLAAASAGAAIALAVGGPGHHQLVSHVHASRVAHRRLVRRDIDTRTS